MKKTIKTLLLTLALLAIPTLAHAENFWFRVSNVAAITGHGMDLGSTVDCLARKACHELNPALARFNGPLTFSAGKMLFAGGQLMLVAKLYDSGHRKLAIGINLASAVTFAGLAIKNNREGK